MIYTNTSNRLGIFMTNYARWCENMVLYTVLYRGIKSDFGAGVQLQDEAAGIQHKTRQTIYV
jgi:hypothetical protein